jgi:hypothetical protein
VTRRAWTSEEIATLERLGPKDFAGFHAAHPTRGYDSWEVKRRRLFGGSAGSRPVSKVSVARRFAAVQALKTLAEFVEHA